MSWLQTYFHAVECSSRASSGGNQKQHSREAQAKNSLLLPTRVGTYETMTRNNAGADGGCH